MIGREFQCRWFAWTLLALASAAIGPLQAGPLEVPNRFQGGTQARADQMNANFDAVDAAVDDNAGRIDALELAADSADAATDANASSIAALQSALLATGVQVSVAGIPVGRLLTQRFARVDVDVSGTAGSASEQVLGLSGVGTADSLILVSATGYIIGVSATSFGSMPLGPEGTLTPLPRLFSTSDCTGQAYMPVEGPVGIFSTFEPGIADNPTVKRWFARQGFAFRSSDPVAGELYMVRRNQNVEQVSLNSVFLWSDSLGGATCVDLAGAPGHAGNEINSAVTVETLNAEEVGIPADMSGALSVGI